MSRGRPVCGIGVMNRKTVMVLAAALAACGAGRPARATWSIILVDTVTKEVGVASATCLPSFDLRRGLPVVRVGRGAGCAQSFVDVTGQNRLLIFNQLAAGTDPLTILQLLQAQDAAHQTRQYGIVDTLGRAVTFSGAQNGAYANGVTGSSGTLVYAIQGNVITGQAVIDAAESAVVTAAGGIPEKLMAGMEAARALGGDGRCSCNPTDATACGAPPENKFTHSAYVGFVIVARRGDIEGGCNSNRGCASGTYYMNLNFATGTVNTPDPVVVLRGQFDAHRAARISVPDAIESRATLVPERLPNVPGARAELFIELRDWQGGPATLADGVDAQVDPQGSAGVTQVGHATSLGDGQFVAYVEAGAAVGVDRVLITVRDPFGTRYLMPSPALRVYQPADMDCSGNIDFGDLDGFVLALLDPAGYRAAAPDCVLEAADVNLDGQVDFADIDPFVNCVLAEDCP
jgi:hypothetical protein